MHHHHSLKLLNLYIPNKKSYHLHMNHNYMDYFRPNRIH